MYKLNIIHYNNLVSVFSIHQKISITLCDIKSIPIVDIRLYGL